MRYIARQIRELLAEEMADMSTKTNYEVVTTFLFHGTLEEYERLEARLVSIPGPQSGRGRLRSTFKPTEKANGTVFSRGIFWPFAGENEADSFAALLRTTIVSDKRVTDLKVNRENLTICHS